MKFVSRMSLAMIVACGLFNNVQAGMVWDETTHGDLSNDGLVPTPLLLTLGSNLILGSTGNDGTGIDRDYFRVTVPEGTQLTSLMLLASTSVSGGVSFIGIQPGPQLTVSPGGAGVENLIGLGHYGNDQIGTDLLPAIAIGSYTSLQAGTYSIWVQETGGSATYGFDFATTPVPVPGAAWLLMSGLTGLVSLRRKRIEGI